MLRRLLVVRSRYCRVPLCAFCRRLSTGPNSTPRSPVNTQQQLPSASQHPQSLNTVASPSPPLFPLPPSRPSRRGLLLSGTLISALAASAVFLYPSDGEPRPGKVSDELRELLRRSHDTSERVLAGMRQTGAAAAVLWKSLASVLSSANHEVQKGFELRVAALVADIAAANEARRAAIVAAGDGMVIDWLLERVAVGPGKQKDDYGTQAETARALAHLIADPNVCGAVLGRPHAVPNLLRFIFSFQPKKAKKYKHRPLDGPDSFRGRSMLVAAIMDIITSNCDNIEKISIHPSLPADADTRDIATALQVVEEGGIHFDEQHEDEDDGDRGVRGIGIKVLGGPTVLGFSGVNNMALAEHSEPDYDAEPPSGYLWQRPPTNALKATDLDVSSVPGLWDDLQREHVAVPFAAWALANWASASEQNRLHIQELDSDGLAIMSALSAPERTVKWHGSLVAKFLLEDQSLSLADSVPDWSISLLSTVSQASKNDDIALSQAALSAFLISVERSSDAQAVIMDKGIHLLRETAKRTEKHRQVQETLAKALELLCMSEQHLSLDESQRWAGILLRWIFSKFSSEALRLPAIKILSCIFEDYGPGSIPISQGWLAILLNEILQDSKTGSVKGSLPEKTDKVKTQIDQSNVVLASQIANQLASSVVSLSANQLQPDSSSFEMTPLADFLSLEPFASILKGFNKDKSRKFDAADSASSTLKGVKALTELCGDDSSCLDKVVEFGGLCMLRRFLLGDDYEKLAAIETYDASRVLETQERGVLTKDSSEDGNDPSSIRVPPTAHVRRHAARLLMVLSFLPKVKKAIIEDQTLSKWLEDCATGRIACCSDLKIQSYARAILLNVFCSEQGANAANDGESNDAAASKKLKCPQFGDMVFLLNPELPQWKYCRKGNMGTIQQESSGNSGISSQSEPSASHKDELAERGNDSSVDPTSKSNNSLDSAPLIDIVFVHGLRGGPFKSWRIADNKSSSTGKVSLVEHIDQEAGKQGTCWPKEWLAFDFPEARMFTVKYKTHLSQWTGASLPLQEVSLILLHKLMAAGIGERPIVFVTHSMGGLVVKQMLYQANMLNLGKFVDNTIGVVFYSCPHFGSKLADMPWRMGLVLRPAPTIVELRSGSPRLMELNEFLRSRHNKGFLKILSFSETLVTPIVEGYGGWAFRMEIVPIESAYPGFGDIIVLDGTDHINSCKPLNRGDPSYAKTLEFLEKLKANLT